MDYWQDDKIGQRGYKKNKRGERKLNLCSDSSDSPEIPDRVRKTSEIAGLPSGPAPTNQERKWVRTLATYSELHFWIPGADVGYVMTVEPLE